MNSILIFFLLASFSSTVFLTSFSNADWMKVRETYAFDHQTKWDCFYMTTAPVDNMDPAVWRVDQYGNLLMAGLNFNCKGCLCYTFDHRYPISSVGFSKYHRDVAKLMSSIDNCQALSFRTNVLKGSNEDEDIKDVIGRFGCDAQTMSLFKDKDYMGARAVQNYLINDERLKQIHMYYTNYVEGPNYLNPETVDLNKDEYFKVLNKNAQSVSDDIKNHLSRMLAA